MPTVPVPKLNNSTFNLIRWVVELVLPALGTLYFTLDKLWGLPNASEVVGTIIALATFLGVVLGLSRAQFKQNDSNFDGTLHIDKTDEHVDMYHFEAHRDIDDLPDQMTFRVQEHRRK